MQNKNFKTLALAILLSSGLAHAAAKNDPITTTLITEGWMSPDVGAAWRAGYTGKGVNILNMESASTNPATYIGSHAEGTAHYMSSIAPGANLFENFDGSVWSKLDGSSPSSSKALNVANLSFIWGKTAGSDHSKDTFTGSLRSLQGAANGLAVVVNSAGNYSQSYSTNTNLNVDILLGKPSAIIAGSLDGNGTPTNQAKLSSYSNYPGKEAPEAFKNQFLTVGVACNCGTSEAAPIIAGYAAIIGSKFQTATATQVTNQLLNTARTDTLKNYSRDIYGRGEASLSRALAPISIK